MKKTNLLAIGFAAGATVLLSPMGLQAGVLDSPHDFSTRSWNNSPSDPNSVCSPCHQAHTPIHSGAAGSLVQLPIPLWNHDTSTGPWQMYNTNKVLASTMKATPAATPQGPSLACLSCHDGTVAINAYGGASAANRTPAETIGAAGPQIGPDLTHTHPISFTYDANLVGTGPNQDRWLFNPDTTQVLQPDSGVFVPGNNMTITGFLLSKNHQLECISCHDVHNQEGSPFNLASNPKLVKIVGTQAGKGSLLCRSCHNK